MASDDPFRLIGFAFIFVGFIQIFTRDMQWKIEKARDSFFGKRVERTPLWDFWRILLGVIAICVGLGAVLH